VHAGRGHSGTHSHRSRTVCLSSRPRSAQYRASVRSRCGTNGRWSTPQRSIGIITLRTALCATRIIRDYILDSVYY
jgi:hypothetical protein